jgi:hypothetical protein
MKLYVLFNSKTDQVKAITEDKEYIYRYIIQNQLSDEFQVTKLKDEKLINKYLIIYENLMLDEQNGFILTYSQRKLINNTNEGELSFIEDTIDSLRRMLKDYNLKDKDYAALYEAILVLSKNSKPKRLSVLLRTKEFILNLLLPKNKGIVDMFNDDEMTKDNMYYIHIKMDD